MAVESGWLTQVRRQNRARFGLEGLGGLGASTGAQNLVEALNKQRDTRTLQIHSGIHDRIDPVIKNDPTGAAALVRMLPDVSLPAQQQQQAIPREVMVVGGLLALGILGIVAYSAVKG